MKKITSLLLSIMLLCATGCNNTSTQTDNSVKEDESQILNLTGNWKQTNSNEPTSYHKAIIEDDYIEIYWVFEDDDTEALYWAGTYEAPTDNEKEYRWDSVNNKEKTNVSLFASTDEAKEFVYKNGIISYSASAFGVKQTVKLEKE